MESNRFNQYFVQRRYESWWQKEGSLVRKYTDFGKIFYPALASTAALGAFGYAVFRIWQIPEVVKQYNTSLKTNIETLKTNIEDNAKAAAKSQQAFEADVGNRLDSFRNDQEAFRNDQEAFKADVVNRLDSFKTNLEGLKIDRQSLMSDFEKLLGEHERREDRILYKNNSSNIQNMASWMCLEVAAKNGSTSPLLQNIINKVENNSKRIDEVEGEVKAKS
jgi:cytochrome c556